MAVSVKVTGGKDWKKAILPYLKGNGIVSKVGILEGSTYSGETAPAGTLVAPIAAAQEFGCGNNPARSFMRSTVSKKNKTWIKIIVAYLKANPGKLFQAFMLLGKLASKDMQQAIEDGINPVLAPETIKRKQRRGKQNPNTPLIDSGTLQESISYEVTKK